MVIGQTKYVVMGQCFKVGKSEGGIFNMDHAVCITCKDDREYIINRLPKSGAIRVCPNCGESSFQIWDTN